ncbi:MAG: sugar transferase [Pseudomonadota bacterium]
MRHQTSPLAAPRDQLNRNFLQAADFNTQTRPSLIELSNPAQENQVSSSQRDHSFPYGSLKRVFDIIGTAAILTALSPLLLVLTALLKANGHRALFRHRRIGHNGRAFKCIKFQTMVSNADQVLKEHLEQNPTARAEWNRDHKLKNDPRVTGIGRFLRATSLDELPQLFNVICGDMSLVGPRPVTTQELARYGMNVTRVLSVRPGMTGLWQVSGRNNLTYGERVALDCHYIQTASFREDLAILIKTVEVLFRRDGC